MNALCAEIALRLESAMVHMTEEHYEAVINFETDALSRLSQGAQIPERLLNVFRQPLPPREASFFWAWPRGAIEESSSAAASAETGQGACGRMEVAPLRR